MFSLQWLEIKWRHWHRQEASSNGCSRLDFHVLEWNEARRFYESKGAVNLTTAEKWCYYRLSGEALASVSQHGGDAREP